MACIPSIPFQQYTGSDVSATAIIQTPAFSLQGAATGNLIPLTGLSKWILKPGIPPGSYTPGDVSRYDIVQYPTENILGGVDYISNTTLLYNGIQFKLLFIAVHSNIWSASPIQVSMVFTMGREVFHIAIPIEYDPHSKEPENQFLKWWLYTNPSGTKPTSFSANDLLTFGGPTKLATFDLYNFCTKTTSKYYFCNFTTPLYINSGQLPQWLATDPTFQATNRLNTFNFIFNAMFQGTEFFLGEDPNIMSSTPLFSKNGNPTGVKPSKFSVRVSILAYKNQTKQTERHLQNVKCYPIDLASQVDENGNIYIDETSKKPIDISNLTNKDSNSPTAAQTATQNNWLYWFFFCIIMFIVIACIVAFVIYCFSTQDTSPVATPPSVTPNIGKNPAPTAPTAPTVKAAPTAPTVKAAPTAQPQSL